MTRTFFRVMLGTTGVVAMIAVTGCSAPEQSVTEFMRNAEVNEFCAFVLGSESLDALGESFLANPNPDDAEAFRSQFVNYNTTAQRLAPDDIVDAVTRSGPGPIDLIDLMMSTGFDPSLVDPADGEAVADSVESSLAATDEVQAWMESNC